MGFVIELLAALVLFGSLLGYLIHNSKITSASLEFFARGFLKLIAFFIVSTLVVFSYLFYQDRAIVPFEFVGIKLNMNKDEVLYVMGQPVNSIPNKEQVLVPLFILNQTKNTFFNKIDYLWQFQKNGYEVDVYFDSVSEKISEIRCTQNINQTFLQGSTCVTNTISLGSSENNIIDKFGKPDSIIFDDGMKGIIYKNYNTQFVLLKQKVIGIIIKNTIDNK